jgi:PEP-CTERM motif-containing protein
MKKLVASLAFAAAVMYGTTAKAAPVDIVVDATPAGGNTLSITVNSAVQVGAVSLHLDPAAGDTFTPTALVSALDSVLTGEFIILNAPAGVPFNGTAANLGTFVLGAFTGAHFTSCNGNCTAANGLYEDTASFGDTVITPTGGHIDDSFKIAAPEPTSLVLLGVAAAGLALVRRKA